MNIVATEHRLTALETQIKVLAVDIKELQADRKKLLIGFGLASASGFWAIFRTKLGF